MIPPLIDPEVLETLASEVGDAAAERFARDVARLWPQRRARLAAALRLGDNATALDAALSLRTAASMAGAVRLAAAADRIVALVRSQDLQAARPLLAEASACGDLTAVILARGLPALRATTLTRPLAAACNPRL